MHVFFLIIVNVLHVSSYGFFSYNLNNNENRINVVQLDSNKKKVDGLLKSGIVNMYYITLTKSDALGLYRVGIEILEEKNYDKFGTDPILEITSSNGRDSIAFKLPVIEKNKRIYKYGKLLDPLMPTDFGLINKTMKTYSNQTLIITAQSRLKQDINFLIHIRKLDRSQYVVRFKSDNVTIPNQHLAFSKPIGFFFNVKEQNLLSLTVKVTSEDDICSILVSVPQNKTLHETILDSKNFENRRYVTFTRRADLYFSPSELKNIESFRIFAFINPDETICDPTAEKKETGVNKKLTFEFVKSERMSVFFPILTTIIIFTLPLVFYISSKIQKAFITSASNECELIVIDNSSNEIHQNRSNEESNHIEIIDSLSNHGEMLKYPLAIVVPIFMHTALEYRNWIRSSSTNKDDSCFYNHACAYPLGEFRAFNNVISNLGYFIFGSIIITLSLLRRKILMRMRNFGVHESVLLDVTVGLFLIMQSIASSTYHLCPSDVAFQFDTPFIQATCGLLIIRQWFNRKETPLPSNSIFLLAFIAIVNLFVSAFSKSENIRSYFAIIHLLIVGAICKVEYSSLIKKRNLKHAKIFATTFFIENILLEFLYFFNPNIHPSQFLTYVFIVNFAFFIIYYTIVKISFDEIIPKKAIVVGFFAVFFWVAALIIFSLNDTDWNKTSAQSRSLNKPCLFLDFFGSHDIWHIISAYATFFTFSYVLFIDDNLYNIPKTSIRPIFNG